MIDWTKTMSQTFEYYIVDPGTWKDQKRFNDVTSCTIKRDSDVETLGSASIVCIGSVGECYIRAYLVASQNGESEKVPLGTFLVQTPSSKFDGKIRKVTMDAYTPLIELKETMPPIGFSVMKNANVMYNAYLIVRERVRAPVVRSNYEDVLYSDFVANNDDTWMSFLIDLIANAKCEFQLDELGRVLFSPVQDTASLQPVWEYNDGNSSILYPDIDLEHDLFGIPNVVEMVYSKGNENYTARVVNDDPNSPTSTVNRGREIVHRETDWTLPGEPTNVQIREYAKTLLKQLSSVDYTVTYSHGYCPVRLGDCVLLNYERAGIKDIKAKVTSQSIDCTAGCKVTETAVFTTKLWG